MEMSTLLNVQTTQAGGPVLARDGNSIGERSKRRDALEIKVEISCFITSLGISETA